LAQNAGSNYAISTMKNLVGHFLFSDKSIFDKCFRRAVILLLEHHPNGAMGVIVNHPSNMMLAEAWAALDEPGPLKKNAMLHHGGPGEGLLVALHEPAAAEEDEIVPGLSWSVDENAVKRLVQDPPNRVKYCIGYAGWAPGQLEKELAEGSWDVEQADAEAVLGDNSSLWMDHHRRRVIHTLLPKQNEQSYPQDPNRN